MYEAPSFCTITESNLAAIPAGTKEQRFDNYINIAT